MMTAAFLTAFFLGVLIVLPTPASATGVIPALLEVPAIAAGTSVERTVIVSRSDQVDQTAYADVFLEGEAADFIEHVDDPAKEFEPGVTQLEHKIVIHTQIEDEDGNDIILPEGDYTATFRVGQNKDNEILETEAENGGTSSGQIVLSGAQGDIWFSVTNDQIEEYEIETFSAANTEERLPVVVSYRMVNTGNIGARPASVQMTFTGVTDATFELEAEILAQDMPFVLPYGQEEVSITTDIDLPAGQYAVSAVFYNKQDEVVYEHESATLQVFPAGTLDQRAELVLFETDKEAYEAAEIVEFIGEVENTGTIGLLGSLIVEVEKDGQKVDILTSDELFIAINRTAELDFTFNPEIGGEFTATGYFKYGPYKTDESEITFTVAELGNATVLIAIGVLIVIIVLIVLLWKKRMRKRSGGATTQAAPAQPAAQAAPQNEVAAMQKQLEEMQKQLEEMQKQLAAATAQKPAEETPAESAPEESAEPKE